MITATRTIHQELPSRKGIFPILTTPPPRATVELFAPKNDTGTGLDWRQHYSEHLSAALTAHVRPGQRGRVVFVHSPGPFQARTLLELPLGPLQADTTALADRLTGHGVQVRVLPDHERPPLDRHFGASGPAIALRVDSAPEATDPGITTVLLGHLHALAYVYVVEFERHDTHDVPGLGPQCTYDLQLVMPPGARDQLHHASAALFEMNGTLASPRRARTLPWIECAPPVPNRLLHRGHTRTIADLVPFDLP